MLENKEYIPETNFSGEKLFKSINDEVININVNRDNEELNNLLLESKNKELLDKASKGSFFDGIIDKFFGESEKELKERQNELSLLKNKFEKFVYDKILDAGFSDEVGSKLISKINLVMEEKFGSLDIDTDGKLDNEEREKLVLLLQTELSNIVSELVDKQKMNDILLSVIENNFNIEVSLNFTYKDREYRSIDNHNPIIDTTKDYSKELKEYVKKNYRDKGSKLLHVGNPLNKSDGKLENPPEENLKLQKIITDFYEQNKEIIDEKFGITNISNLSPAQASKLVAHITMSKLNFNSGQGTAPTFEKYYYNLSESEQFEYKKDYFTSVFVRMAYLNSSEDYVNIYETIVDNYSDKLKGFTLEEVFTLAKEKGNEHFEKNDIDEHFSKFQKNMHKLRMKTEKPDKFTFRTYTSNGVFWKKNSVFDSVPVSEMLEKGKGVCRNYAISNEKLFEAMKGLQEKDNNKLQNSVLVYYSGNSKGSKFNTNVANNESGTTNHAWNTLVTIGKDGKEYVSQIDATHADTGGKEGGKGTNEGIKQIDTIDRTYERLFNDLADNLTEKEFKIIDTKIKNYILSLEKTDGNEEQVSLMRSKLLILYHYLDKTEETSILDKEILVSGGYSKEEIQFIESNVLSTDTGSIFIVAFKKYINLYNLNDLVYIKAENLNIRSPDLKGYIDVMNKYTELGLGFGVKEAMAFISKGLNILSSGGDNLEKIILDQRKKYPNMDIDKFAEKIKKEYKK